MFNGSRDSIMLTYGGISRKSPVKAVWVSEVKKFTISKKQLNSKLIN